MSSSDVVQYVSVAVLHVTLIGLASSLQVTTLLQGSSRSLRGLCLLLHRDPASKWR